MKKLLYIIGICNIFLDVNCVPMPLQEGAAQEQGNPAQAKYLLCPYGLLATSPATEEDTILKVPSITLPPLREKIIITLFRNLNASIQTVSNRYHGIEQTFESLLESRERNFEAILTSCKKREQLFEAIYGIRRAVGQLLSHYKSFVFLIVPSERAQAGLFYLSLRSQVEKIIKQLFQMPYKCDYKQQSQQLVNDLAEAFCPSENSPSDLCDELIEFSCRLSASMDTLQTLMVERDQSMFRSETVGKCLFIQLFPRREFCEQILYDLVLNIESSMSEVYRYNASEYQLLLTFLSDWREKDERWYEEIYKSYLERYLCAKNEQLYKQIVEYKQMLLWIMIQWGRDMQMYDQLKYVLCYTECKEENLIGFKKIFDSAMLRNAIILKRLQQRKNMLMFYFNGIFNFEITDILSFKIKKIDDLVSIICNCKWSKDRREGSTEISLQEDKRDYDEIVDLGAIRFVSSYSKIPENIFLSLVKYKILGCRYPIFCTDKPLFNRSLIWSEKSGLYVYIQLPLIEEMIQCKKMLDSGLIDTKILESDAVRKWLEIFNNVRILNLPYKKNMYKRNKILSDIRNNIVYFTTL